MAEKYPILAARIADGSIKLDNGEYVGIASDGAEASIGYDFAPEKAERYLTDFPTPDMW